VSLDDTLYADRHSDAVPLLSTRDWISQVEAHQDRIEQRRTAVVTWLTGGWLLVITWWVSSNFARLRIARALLELEEIEQGAPITDDDHLSSFPDLYADFEALDLTSQSDIYWFFTLAAFGAVGAVIAVGAVFTRRRRPLLAVIITAWAASVALALANGETLSLLGWLTN